MFPASTKREITIRHFHVVVEQRRSRNVQKGLMHVQSCCFANLNLLLFCRCRCRRRCLSSLISSHSTETALLKVHNDILMNMDSQRVTLLVLLDLSAALTPSTLTSYSIVSVQALASGALLYFGLRLIFLIDLSAFLSTRNFQRTFS